MILVLTGPVHSGKTTLLRKLVPGLRDQKIAVDGYLSVAVFKDRELIGYDLFDLKEEKASPFLRKKGKAHWERAGPYFFAPQALEKAKRKILRRRRKDFLVVDEVGPLEIRGGGIWPELQAILSNPSLRCLLVARRNILEEFRNLLKPVAPKIFDIESPDVFRLLREEIQKAGRVKNGRFSRAAVYEE
jgi:nucleoside-triphosphatase THEP1